MGWLVRIGLGFAVPYIIPSLIGLIFGGGFVANWWFQWIEFHDVVLLIAAAILIYLYAIAPSEWARLLYVIGLVGCAYIGGRFHEYDLQQPRIEEARQQVHKQYKGKIDAEVARLTKVNEELRAKGTAATIKQMTLNARLRKERDDAIEKAKKLPGASDVVYTPDDIDILNSVRHGRKRARVQGDSGKAKP